jgi:hypothetical protein
VMTEKTPFPESLPSPGLAEVRITADSPETARQVAAALRRLFDAPEQSSGPAGPDGSGTCLLLTVDTTRAAGQQQPFRPRLVPDDRHSP